jgi:hypothetical protein
LRIDPLDQIEMRRVHAEMGCVKSTVLILAASLMSAVVCSARAAVPVESAYSGLVGKNCRSVEKGTHAAYSMADCGGVGGFRLLVLHDDDRASVTVVTPEGKKFPLEFWDVVTPAFSDLGARAEWRILRDREKVTPIALIVRVNYTGKKSAAAAPTPTSVLAVAKICVVRAVQDGRRANEQARKAADAASTRPCLHRPS